MDEALADAFPWIDFLPTVDRRAFTNEFSHVAIAAAELDSYGPPHRVADGGGDGPSEIDRGGGAL